MFPEPLIYLSNLPLFIIVLADGRNLTEYLLIIHSNLDSECK